MTRTTSSSRGRTLASRLFTGARQAERALRPGTRCLPLLEGITPACQFTLPQENVLSQAREFLVESGRIFRYGNSIVLEIEEDGKRTIRPLVTDCRVEPAAASLLSNVFICELRSQDPHVAPIQFPPPSRFVELLLNHEPTRQRIPEIRLYATRPVFDDEFVFRGPGWHGDVQYLVHGPDVEPSLPDCVPTSEQARDRLLPRLRELLRDFCFRSGADLVNAVAVLVTGMLMSLFVRNGKPMVLLDGNQPGIGKTLLARVFGIVCDGNDPDAIHFTSDDEELGKRICANLRGKPTSVVLIDNAKMRAGGEVSSPVLEANSMAPEVSLRILGQSSNYRRPNDLVWFLTMNLTKTSPDLVSRGLPVRFHHEGDPRQRDFDGRDPIEFAYRHRQEILGELAGMVLFWNQQGRPLGHRRHRLTHWATVVGGILEANGLPEFLDNLDEAASEFNTALDDLAALAESSMSEDRVGFHIVVHDGAETQTADGVGHPAGNWEGVFQDANVLTTELATARSQRSKATKIGNFLGQHSDREVPIERGGLTGTARLRWAEARSRRRLYYFEIRFGGADSGEATPDTSDQDNGLGSTVPLQRDPTAADRRDESQLQQTDDERREGGEGQTGGNQEEW